jgi:hypothetical protein
MFGIAAPRVAVRTAMPWYLRWFGPLVLGLTVMLLSREAFDFGRRFAGFNQNEVESELHKLREANASLQQELTQLRGQLAQGDGQRQIERATYNDLVKQIKALANENSTIKEDLVFFQTLMPSSGKEGRVTASRFLLQSETAPGEYRYQLLLTQTGQRSKDFVGNVQFVVNLLQDNKKMVMALPSDGNKDAQGFKLNFRLYQRLDGTFRVAPGAVVNSIQARVFENGASQPILTQTANAS